MVLTQFKRQKPFGVQRWFSQLFWVLVGLVTLGVTYIVHCYFDTTSILTTFTEIWASIVPQGSFKNPSENGIFVTATCLSIVALTMKISPKPRLWSKVTIIALLLSLILRYLLWRSIFTLNFDTTLSSVFSVLLLGMETWILSSYGIQLFLALRERDRRQDSVRLSKTVAIGKYQPNVDILIPSYNEPDTILRRTIVGCQAIDYPHKTIYLLDDTRRPEIKTLTEELGCEYVIRPDNKNAKAGNLNHALDRTNSELVLVFDADFVPTQDFLLKTVGFFQEPDIGMVQTHQHFYNDDLVSRNLGLEGVFPHEVEVFSRHYQKLRDGAESSLCYGSAFVVRRQALAEVGNFVTNTLGEDYFTGIRLSANGYRVIYLDESLSAGLAAENISAHIAQRQRWVRGTLQSFFLPHNPLTIPGLTLRQRIAHLEGILQWFNSLWQVYFLIVPLGYYFLGVLPIQVIPEDWLAYFLPYYMVNLATYTWLNYRSRSALLSGVYGLVTSFPISVSIVQTLISPFSQGFKVTPKGISNDRFVLNWKLALPAIAVFVFTAVGWGFNIVTLAQLSRHSIDASLGISTDLNSAKLGLLWGLYNLIFLGLAVLSFIDAPNPTNYPSFPVRRWVTLKWIDRNITGETIELSEIGATVKLTGCQNLDSIGDSVDLHLFEEDLQLVGTIDRLRDTNNGIFVEISFDKLTTQQHRKLIELLFCQPGQWERQKTPGELRSLGYLLKALVRPPILQRRALQNR
ncbi:MAG: glycosyltransferase [Cyanobacteria bacterium SID2]|nr:glycosyltransferase [Cyanobacteria bacterium SID2]MBP0003935.1 glycosyltransferase [Cyanobacteria bacterium SBC]